jgi:two-component system sensor histidine kinase KdpD
MLRRVTAGQGSRGRLKVFFGASPGVGKTYAMLEAARRRQADGAHVLIGWVETHGRAETAALAEGLEPLAPRELVDRGLVLKEFDLDAALAARPVVLLVDELAHTNAPGSRHEKRWQDVEELLDAGIEVWTTLNVQHLESLHDLVARVTGVTVRETVPDRILDAADEVEFIDLPPEELKKRLAEGKVYVPEHAAQAAHHFFRRGNLLALRELALRRTAEHVDADVQDYRRDHEIEPTWPVAERILVCVRPNPESDRLVRAARRMAARLRAEWIVAYVETDTQPRLSAAERAALGSTFKLAEDLGAETVSMSGHSVSEVLLDHARRRNVSRIVIGKPVHSRWRDRLRGSLLDEVVRGSGGIEVMVIPGGVKEGAPAPRHAVAAPSPGRHLGFVVATVVVLASTAVCALLFRFFENSNLVMVYLLGVAFVASLYGRAPSAFAAVASVGAFDFFFVPPHLTFAVSDTQYLVTFAVMLLVGLLISTLSARVRAQAEAARSREERAQILYNVSRDLASALTADEVVRHTSRHVAGVVEGHAEVLLPGADGTLVGEGGSLPGEARDAAVAQWVFEHKRVAGPGTDTLPGASAMYLPLTGSRSVVGVLGVRPPDALLPLAPEQTDLLQTIARQAGSAVERVRLAADAEETRVAMEAEKLRNTLLSSVSHDLRTPLAAITGAASSLLEPTPLDPEVERGLKEAIYQEARRLSRLVTNLLDMTRLESGTLRLQREWHVLEEIVGAAIARVQPLSGQRPVSTRIPDDLPLVPVDALLIEQVLVNLLENAFKYTPAAAAVDIRARAEGDHVLVQVADQGPGVPAEAREKVFEKFYRHETHGERGFGLGLPICRAIVEAHGGKVQVGAAQPAGAVFSFSLPLGPDAPPAVVDEDGD